MKSYREYVCLLLRVIPFVTNCLAENLILNINVKKLIAVTDHAFLSFTLDPATLQYNDFIKNIEKSTNLARGLAPAYIRLGGPQSNFYNFEQVHSHEVNTDPNNMHFGTQWTFIYQWAKNAGLDVIACISPHYIDKELKTDSTDPRNIAELLSFSDRMGYNISWQLGYECQTRCNLSGGDLGQYVANLHEILKTFPRYSNSLITGPDILAYRTAYQQKYLQDYLHSANAALSAITWHPNLDSVPLSDNNISIYYDNLIAEKDELYKIINHVGKKPLWIAESKSQESEHQYLKALIWIRRLGDTAKLGIQVVMRQLTNLSQATPAYWVSLLYKTLVGREVLELKLQSNSESYVHFYSQCTKPSALYGKGAVTIFGINLTPKTVTTSLKGLKIKILHKYILLPEFEIANKMISEKVLLNNEPLNLKNDKNLPDIYPEIIINPDGLELELPSGGIGFWIIPNAKVKACTCSEEEIIGDNTVKKLSKRHENNIQQLNQEKEEDINQSNLKNEKVYDKQDNETQQNVENISNKNQQKAWSSKLLDKMTNFLQKRLQKINKNDSSQKSVVFNLEEKKKSSEEIEEQQNLDSKKLKKTEIDDKFKNIQHLLNKYKRILLEKKTMMDTKNIQLFQLEIKNIDNVMMLISKIDAFILYNITLKESDTSEIKHKTQNKEELIIKINKKLKEYLSELENSVEIKTNIIKKIEKNFNKLYNLLEYNDLTKDNKNSQVFNHKDLMEQKKFKRHLDKKSKNSQKNSILEKPQKNNLKDYVIKQKIQQKNDNNIDNVKKNFINSKNKYDNPLQRDPVKRFFKNDAFENANRHTNHQHLVQENNKIKNDNICRKYSKINDMEKYQNLIQERMKRDNTKKWVETDLKEDSASRKHSRIDDLTNYVNERKMKPKDGVRRELLLPFNPRIDSDENNFYGFFRQDPVKGFPEGDIFVTAGDSLEQTDDGYDYVKNEDNNNNNGLKKKNTQHSQKSTLDHAKDNTWIEEVKDDHCDYTPNEFFENIQSSNIKIQENSKNYDDLGEAEFLSEVHNNNNKNNNKIAITKIIRKQPLNEENEKHIKKTRIQRLVHYYDDLKKQEFNRDKLQSASRYPSTSFNHLLKIPNSNINYQESNVKFEGAKLKKKPESKISNFFYPPSEASTIRYNYNNNYQISNMNYDTLKEKNGFDKDIDSSDNAKITEYSRPNLYAEHSVYNNIFHNKRNKRSNSEELRKIFVQEIVKEDEENARDCHCRIIRASDSPKKLYYHRMKRNILVPTAKVTDTSLENTNESANVAQFLKGLTTEEEYQEIMTGDILPSTSDIEPDYEENDITTKSVITELRKLNHNLSNTAHEVNNAKKSTTNLLPVDLDSKLSINNNDSVKYITKETFFRTQDIQSENKTKTYDSPQIISKTFSENKNVREEIPISTTNNAQETIYKKIQELNKKEPDSSIYPTITEDNKNEEGNNNNYKISLKSINPLKETTKGIVEQVTMETILLKRAASTAIDNTKSNELLIKSKLLRNTHIEDNQNSESAWIPLGKDANMRRLKTKLQNLPQTSLGLTRYEKHLTKRAEQTDIKLKEKLYARREKLLHQYQNKLTKIANEQKRNLKRKEGDDNFRRLIDILDIHQVFAKLKSGKAQHQVSRLQEYIKKLPIKDYYDQERTNSTNNLDKQKQYDLSKKLPEFAQVWLISLNRRNVDQANNKEINKLNDIHKNFKADRDNLNSTFAINETIEFIKSFGIERKIENKEFDSSNDKKRNIMHSETTEDAEDVKTKKYENVEMTKHEKINESYNINDKVENNLNITMFNNNKTVEHVKNIEDNAKEEELGKKNSRFRRGLGKQTCKCTDQLAPSIQLTENRKKILTNIQHRLKEESIKKIFDTKPMTVYLLTKNNKSSNVSRIYRSKNYSVFSRKDFVNQQNQKKYNLNYITLTPIPIEIKNILEILDTKTNDDSTESFEISQWDDQNVLEEILDLITEQLNDKTLEEFEYEDPSNLQSENSEIILHEENYMYENKQDVTANDSEIESEEDEKYKITNDEINKFLKMENQIGSKCEMFLLLSWENVNIRQQRQIKSEIDEDIAEIKRKVTKQSQPNKSFLAEDRANKRTKRYYLNNNIDEEEEKNMIETKRVSYLQPQTKNSDNLIKDFVKTYKKNNLYNNKDYSVKNEETTKIKPLNNISKSDKKILQKEMPRLQSHTESMEEFVNDSKENFNDTLVNGDKHRNGTSGTTDNVFYIEIMNIKDLLAFFAKMSRMLYA